MKKAEFIGIRKTKKGDWHGLLQFADGQKDQPIPNYFKVNDSLNGHSCEVDLNNGQVKNIYVEGKELARNLPKQSHSRPNQPFNSSGDRRLRLNHGQSRASQPILQGVAGYAMAPYNFVPLNKKVVVSEFSDECLPPFDIYSENLLSGYIELEMKTMTPLFIGGKSKEKDKNKPQEKPREVEFFAPNGRPRIPGSSIRGMVRTLVEIASHGSFNTFNDDQLYYRAVGENTSIGNKYREQMMEVRDKSRMKVKSGIMRKRNQEYCISPSVEVKGTQIYKVKFDSKINGNREVAGNSDIALPEFTFEKIYFKPVTQEDHTHSRMNKGEVVKYKLKYALVNEISRTPFEDSVEGYIVSSGNLGDKKHMHWIINTADEKVSKTIPDNVIESYIGDSSRNDQFELLDKVNCHNEGVPCFYLEDEQGNIVAFGHTGLFRMSYNNKIGDLVKQDPAENFLDMAEAIFGKVSDHRSERMLAGRVFFEDGILQGEPSYIEEGPLLALLATPNPTAFQHYLIQPQGKNTLKKELEHWDCSNTVIRGYKNYWHKDINNQIESMMEENVVSKLKKDEEINKLKKDKKINKLKLYTKFSPISTGSHFISRIRFDNLSNIELGALLFALNLRENHCHKLGMGKPLGMGSIKISPKLRLINRRERYERLFNSGANGWNESFRDEDMNESMKECIEEFERYVLEKSDEDRSVDSLWSTERMKDLAAILDWNNTTKIAGWTNKVNYLDLELFGDRKVLPTAREVTDD